MSKIFFSALILSFLFIGIACSKSNSGGGGSSVDCNTVANKAFAADVSPIIQSTCAITGCHEAGSLNGPGGLTNYTQISTASSSIQSAVSTGRMPKSGSLSTSQKNSILCWIQSGAPNN